jgi:hypothetical protein
MKRALDVLLRDERERQEDDLLRAQLERNEAAEAAAKKQKTKEKSFIEKWRSHLLKWDEMGLESFAERALVLPVPDPPGHVPRVSFLVSFLEGATLDLAALGRSPSELDCLFALVHAPIWEALLTATNSRMASELSSGTLVLHRRYKPATIHELQQVLFARLDLIVRGVPNIEAGFHEARTFPTSSHGLGLPSVVPSTASI